MKRIEKRGKLGVMGILRKYKYAYILITPAILLTIVFRYLQFGGLIIAFKEFTFEDVFKDPNVFKAIWKSTWVGLDNFIHVFSYPKMLLAIKNTLIYGFFNLVLGFPFPIILALLFNELRNLRFKKVVQTVSYMPHFLSWISVIGLCYSMLALEGPINQFLVKIFGEGISYSDPLMDANCFLPVIFLSNIWKNVGWSSVVFLAAIAGIDTTLYEAAKVDGCGKFRQVLNITLPCISETIIIVFIMSAGQLVNTNFEQVYGFQNIFTQEKTEVINTLVYRQGIQNGQYDIATAFGLVQGIVNVSLILGANAISKKLKGTSIW